MNLKNNVAVNRVISADNPTEILNRPLVTNSRAETTSLRLPIGLKLERELPRHLACQLPGLLLLLLEVALFRSSRPT